MTSLPKKNSRKLIITIGILSFVILVFLFPAWGTLDNLSNQQKEKEVYLSSFKNKKEAFLNLEKNYNEASKISEKLYQALPEKKDESTLINSFYTLENTTGIKIISIKFESSQSKKTSKEKKEKSSPLSQTVKEGDLYILPIKIEIEGNYQNFYRFLQSLQNNTRYIRIDKIKISGVSKDPSSKITATLETTVYLKP